MAAACVPASTLVFRPALGFEPGRRSGERRAEMTETGMKDGVQITFKLQMLRTDKYRPVGNDGRVGRE